jgi:hypothetical protein
MQFTSFRHIAIIHSKKIRMNGGRYAAKFLLHLKKTLHMKAVRVQYTIKPEYVEQNKRNIEAVMKDLRENPIDGMFYSTFQLQDQLTFMHVNFARDGETMAKLNALESFTKFRMELMASQPTAQPKSEDMGYVGASFGFAE